MVQWQPLSNKGVPLPAFAFYVAFHQGAYIMVHSRSIREGLKSQLMSKMVLE